MLVSIDIDVSTIIGIKIFLCERTTIEAVDNVRDDVAVLTAVAFIDNSKVLTTLCTSASAIRLTTEVDVIA